GGAASLPATPPYFSHTGDELFHPFVDRFERVLAQHGALCLIIELQVHPVDGEITALFLGTADELSTQTCPGRLGRYRLGLEDLQIVDDTVHLAAPLHQVEQPAVTMDVVVGEVELGHPR